MRKGERGGEGKVGLGFAIVWARMGFNWASLLTEAVVHNANASENRGIN